MDLQPKKTKYRTAHRVRPKGLACRGTEISFGSFAAQALEPTWLTSRQLEAIRIAATREMKRQGNLWILVFPDRPITKKPAEVRMGKGKGGLDHYVAVIKPGRILFEMDNIPKEIAQRAVKKAAYKLSIKLKFITRRDYVAE